MSLGDLINRIIYLLKDDPITKIDVFFDFCEISPTSLSMFKGTVGELSLGYKCCECGQPEYPIPTKAQDLYNHLVNRLGQSMRGYDDLEYIIRGDMPVWVANPAYSGRTAVTGAFLSNHNENRMILKTRYIDFS